MEKKTGLNFKRILINGVVLFGFLISLSYAAVVITNNDITKDGVSFLKQGDTWTTSQNLGGQNATNGSYYSPSGDKITRTVKYTLCKTQDSGCSAVCTDSDCGDDINNAIDFVAANGGGVLQLMEGQFVSNTSILHKQNVYIEGSGRNITIIKAANGMHLKHLIQNSPNSGTTTVWRYGGLSHLGIDLNGINQDATNYVYPMYQGVQDLYIDDIEVQNPYQFAFDVNGAAGNITTNKDVTIRNSLFNGSNQVVASDIVDICNDGDGFLLDNIHIYGKTTATLNGIDCYELRHSTLNNIFCDSCLVVFEGPNDVTANNINMFGPRSGMVILRADLGVGEESVERLIINNMRVENSDGTALAFGTIGILTRSVDNIIINNAVLKNNSVNVAVYNASHIIMNNLVIDGINRLNQYSFAQGSAIYLLNGGVDSLQINGFLFKDTTGNTNYSYPILANGYANTANVTLRNGRVRGNFTVVDNGFAGSFYDVTGVDTSLESDFYMEPHIYNDNLQGKTCTNSSSFASKTIQNITGDSCTCLYGSWLCTKLNSSAINIDSNQLTGKNTINNDLTFTNNKNIKFLNSTGSAISVINVDTTNTQVIGSTLLGFVYFKSPSRYYWETSAGNPMTLRDGKLGLGTLSPVQVLDVVGKVNATTGFVTNANTGVTNTTGLWVCTDASCTNKCQLSVNGGIITGCP